MSDARGRIRQKILADIKKRVDTYWSESQKNDAGFSDTAKAAKEEIHKWAAIDLNFLHKEYEKQHAENVRLRAELEAATHWGRSEKMDRYTRSEDGKFALIDWEGLVKMNVEQGEIMTNALARLAAYEDTGMMPDDVEGLKAENARLRDQIGEVAAASNVYHDLMIDAERENTRLRAELEAAKRDIEIALGTQRVCFACKNVMPCSNSITGEYGCDPKWRGLCAENGGAK